MPRLVYLTAAQRDIASILRFISDQSASRAIGRHFVDRLREQCRTLAALPGTLGRARPELAPGIRSFAFQNYVIFFRYRDDRFEVVNVLEGHRDIIEYSAADRAS